MIVNLRQPFERIPAVKPMINIGACLDVPTGTIVKGHRGEHIINGGLSNLTGVVGIGNSFKSTVLHYMMSTALVRVSDSSTANTYDTEMNIQEWHLKKIIPTSIELAGECVIDNGRWVITDKTIYSGNVWYAKLKEFLADKQKNIKSYEVNTPFADRDGKTPFRMMIPTFNQIDSFTEFETDDVTDMQDKNELGDSGANTIHMRQGLAKMRLLMEAPRLNVGSDNYLLMTAHLGKETTMQNAGPGGSVPIVKLSTLKHGDKIKGVTDKFTFVMHNCWHPYQVKPLINQGTKTVEYPKDENDKTHLDTDLNLIVMRNLRAKSGPSGMPVALIVSQSEGVLPTLTEFYNIKETDKFGIDGSNISYYLDIYPDLKLSRTTVRSKIDKDPLLRRAINITSELQQIFSVWNIDSNLVCTMKQLYEDIKKLGYDWNILLNTRGWWSLDEDKLLPFLSSYDLLKLRVGEYKIFWLEDDKKTIKKQYAK